MELRNIGILAHIDAGKTTLSERILYETGAIQKLGSVDKGTASTDREEVEKRRGISVRSACARVRWKGCEINLIDTPGHTDFASETGRALWALDAAVIVVSGAEGVQPQTEALFEAVRERSMPALFFVNKMDRPGADFERTLGQIRTLLTPRAYPVDDMGLMEALSETDEEALEAYVAGECYPRDELIHRARELIGKAEMYPALAGSALTGQGVQALLDAVSELLPGPKAGSGALCGVEFASEEAKDMGRAAYVRLFSGALKNRDSVLLPRRDGREPDERKITQIRRLRADGRGEDAGELTAGDIACVYGLGEAAPGQPVGDPSLLPEGVGEFFRRDPPLMARVLPECEDKLDDARKATRVLALEDPTLSPMWIESARSLHIRVMGEIQLEILEERYRERFGLNVTFGPPSVVYHETISRAAEGFVAYTMPKPCWAIMRFLIEPAPRGSGVTYECVVPPSRLDPRYRRQVEQTIPAALEQGRLGWQVDDVKITLIDGEHHQFHTHPLDFVLATPMGVHDALRRGGSTLLEPMLRCRISVPEDKAGRLMGDIAAMKGEMKESKMRGDMLWCECVLPVAGSVDYPKTLAAYTGGRGSISVRPAGYRACEDRPEAVCPRRNVDPLDTSKYILAMRNALDGGWI